METLGGGKVLPDSTPGAPVVVCRRRRVSDFV
jgi:hypothetical protein